MKFAHLGDCHLGGWKHPELKELNLKSFQYAIDKCIKYKVDFVLVTGDLFDSAYPSIETLKDSFFEFRKLREANIPVFLIAGSHDYSASGKSFLDVLEQAGFCKNTANFIEKNGNIILEPTIFGNVALYGYPGKKSGLEIGEISKIKLQDSPGLFKILMLHTAIRSAVPNPMIEAVDDSKLPKVDYLALSHLHINYSKEEKVYSGPIFPNNLQELEELKAGSFYIFDNGEITREEIKIKEVFVVSLEVKDAMLATDAILQKLSKENVKDKIVILKISGSLEKGKTTDINFNKIESIARENGAYTLLKSTSKLHILESEIRFEQFSSDAIESEIIKKFELTNKNKFNSFIPSLLKSLQVEKVEDERSVIFEERLISEINKVIGI